MLVSKKGHEWDGRCHTAMASELLYMSDVGPKLAVLHGRDLLVKDP
jgi:hypothetical protein